MANNREIYINGTEHGIANRFKLQVIERRPDHPDCGKVVQETPWAPNLILESGMTAIATNVICDLFTYCCVGTDSTPTQGSSGSITATTSGTTCTSSSSIFSSGDVGQLIYFPSTQQSALIESYTNNTTVVLSATLSISSAEQFTIYAVNQTGLGGEVHRTNNYLTGSGNCGTTYTGGVYTHQRTFDFPIETGNQTYNEVGFSNISTAGANLNMRGIFSTAPISVVTGQQIRVIYYVLVTVTPISPRSRTVPISGWPALAYSVAFSSATNLVTLVGYGFALNTQVFFDGTLNPGGVTFGTTYYVIPNDADTFYISTSPSGSHVVVTSDGTDVELFTNTNGQEQLAGDQFSGVNSAGGTVAYHTGPDSPQSAIGEPSSSVQKNMGMSTDDVALPVYNSTNTSPTIPSGGTAILSAGSYSAGTYTLNYTGTITVDGGNSSSIFKLFTYDTFTGTGAQGLIYLFDMPQQKTNLYTLTVVWKFSWGRIFV